MLIVMVWVIVWLACYWLLLPTWPFAQQWLLISAAVLAYCLWFLRRNLQRNHRPDEETLLPTLGPGNHLSLIRGLIVGLLSGFIAIERPDDTLGWIIALSYTTASIFDGLDGVAARRSNHVTLLGQQLDMAFDGLAVAVVSMLMVSFGLINPWFLLVGGARYLFLSGIWWRQRAGKATWALPPSVHRRIMAGMLMGMLTVMLWPILPDSMVVIAATIIGLPVLLGFTRDWLIVSGRLQASNAVYLRLQRMLYAVAARWLPLVWRLLLAITMFLILRSVEPWFRPQAWQQLLQSWHLAVPELFATAVALIGVLGTPLILSGTLGRAAATLMCFPIGFDIATVGLQWDNGVALTCALCIAILGTGNYSLWSPEDALLGRK